MRSCRAPHLLGSRGILQHAPGRRFVYPRSARASAAAAQTPAPAAPVPSNGNGAPNPTDGSSSKHAKDDVWSKGYEDSIEEEALLSAIAADIQPPRPLPPPPASSNLLDVLPFLFKLAWSDAELRLRLSIAMVFMMLSKGCGMLAPLLFKEAVDYLSMRGTPDLVAITLPRAASTITSAVVNALPSSFTHVAVFGGGTVTPFVAMAVASLVLSGVFKAIGGVAKEVQTLVFTPVAQAAGRRVAYHAFRHILSLGFAFHAKSRTGSLSRIVERGTRSVAMTFRAVVFTFVPTIFELVLVCWLLSRALSPSVSLIVLGTFALYAVFTVQVTTLAAEKRREVNRLENLTTSKTVDALMNFETVTLFNNQRLELSQYDRQLVAYHRASVQSDILSCVLNAGQAVILAGGLAAVMAWAALSCGTGVMTPGDLVLANGLILQLWAPLAFLGWFYKELRQSLVDLDQLFDILSTKPSVKEGTQELVPGSYGAVAVEPNGKGPAAHGAGNGNGGAAASMGSVLDMIGNAFHMSDRPSSGAHASTSAPEGAARVEGLWVRMDNVKFGYTPERQVLKGISIEAKPGESIAIVGPSGSGKSTVLKLLMRAYDTDQGTVTLDGQDVRSLTESSLRQYAAVVPQETVLFNDTILNNILYGRPGASEEEAVEAARSAQLHDAIMRMPRGYKTVVGERGVRLSGGEKQRVAIARAVLRSPRLFLCDEATSALDSETERGIMSCLMSLAEGRTAVLVAHRLSTIRNCDTIYVLQRGRVVEKGSHGELLAIRDGIYRGMWKMQAQEERLIQQEKKLSGEGEAAARAEEERGAAKEAGRGGPAAVQEAETESVTLN